RSHKPTEGRGMLRHARTIGIALILVPAITVFMQSAALRPACADELDHASPAPLRSLYEGSPAARVLGEKAAGILVFPNIVKAGFLFGAQFGEGTLYRGGRSAAARTPSSVTPGSPGVSRRPRSRAISTPSSSTRRD